MHINKRFLKKDAVERAERLAHGEWLTRRR
jgi:hypothetical protein